MDSTYPMKSIFTTYKIMICAVASFSNNIDDIQYRLPTSKLWVQHSAKHFLLSIHYTGKGVTHDFS